MKTRFAFVLFLALIQASVAGFFASRAEAKPSQKKSKQHKKTSTKVRVFEKYPGTVNDGTVEEIHAYADTESNKVDEELDSLKPTQRTVSTITKVEMPVMKIEAKSEAKEAKATNEYDVVPSEKIDEVSERIKYAYEILKRFGRAYDYKTVTLTELKQILNDLEKNKS